MNKHLEGFTTGEVSAIAHMCEALNSVDARQNEGWPTATEPIHLRCSGDAFGFLIRHPQSFQWCWVKELPE